MPVEYKELETKDETRKTKMREIKKEVVKVNNKTLYKLVRYKKDKYGYVNPYQSNERIDLKLLTEEEAYVMTHHLYLLDNDDYKYELEEVEDYID